MGIEIASLVYKPFKGNGVAPPPHSNWCQLVPNSWMGIALSST